MAAEQLTGDKANVGGAFTNHGGGVHSEMDVFGLEVFQVVAVGDYRIRVASVVFREARAWVRQNSRVRSKKHETGGLLWGVWDNAIGAIWLLDVSGPPPDSRHEVGHFECGVEGTIEEYDRRMKQTYGSCGFIGFWHTHPGMTSDQSIVDMSGMAELVSSVGQNQRRSVMLIFGGVEGLPMASLHVYESHSPLSCGDLIEVGLGEMVLEVPVV